MTDVALQILLTELYFGVSYSVQTIELTHLFDYGFTFTEKRHDGGDHIGDNCTTFLCVELVHKLFAVICMIYKVEGLFLYVPH